MLVICFWVCRGFVLLCSASLSMQLYYEFWAHLLVVSILVPLCMHGCSLAWFVGQVWFSLSSLE